MTARPKTYVGIAQRLVAETQTGAAAGSHLGMGKGEATQAWHALVDLPVVAIGGT